MEILRFVDLYQVTVLLVITILLFMQLFTQYNFRKKADKKERINESFVFLKKWSSSEYSEIMRNLFKNDLHYRLVKSYKEVDLQIQGEEFNQILIVLNFFEELAISIENGLCDEEILKLYMGQNTVRMYKLLEPVIINLRKQQDNSTLYRNFERIVGKWVFEIGKYNRY